MMIDEAVMVAQEEFDRGKPDVAEVDGDAGISARAGF
jgi:hypothetical protein